MKKPQHHRPVRRALIIGAGEAGCMVLRELARHPEMGLQAVALIDDDPAVQGTQVCGLTVAGTTTEIADVADAHDVSEVIIAMPSQPGAVIHRIISQLQQDAPQLKYSIIPGIRTAEWQSGREPHPQRGDRGPARPSAGDAG